MSLSEFLVTRDRFEIDEDTMYEFCFPCNVCIHKDKPHDADPCRVCDHNDTCVHDNEVRP